VTERACESCGFPDPELVLVRRVYVVPETWDQPASEQVVDPPELWCVSCISQYPCRAADPHAADPEADDPDDAAS
jgi:hypothetical protein